MIKRIVQEYLHGDKEWAKTQIQELKSNSSYLEDIAPYFNEKTDELFIDNLTQAVRLFCLDSSLKSRIVDEFGDEEQLVVLNQLFSTNNKPIQFLVAEHKVNEADIAQELYIIRNLFSKMVGEDLNETELDLLNQAGVDAVLVELVTRNDSFVFAEKLDAPSPTKLISALDSALDSIRLFAMKNITPRTVAVATVAISVGMSLLGSSSAHASMNDAHGFLGSDNLNNALDAAHKGIVGEIQQNLGQALDHSSVVKLVANDIQGSGHMGSGHFNIQVGDCFVEGKYHQFNSSVSVNEAVEVTFGITKEAGSRGMTGDNSVCLGYAKDIATALQGVLTKALAR